MDGGRKIRVLCVDDSDDISEMLGRCIAAEPDMESAGSLHTADDLAAAADRTRADVVLLDMKMPGKDPLEALRGLTATRAHPTPSTPSTHPDGPGRSAGSAAGCDGKRDGAGDGPRVIAYSGQTDQAAVDSAVEAGAWGYISKDAAIPEVLSAIREVARGRVALRTGW